MGQCARARRQQIKREFRSLGFSENDPSFRKLLERGLTKAEARVRLVRIWRRNEFEKALIANLSKQICEDVDREILEELGRAAS